MLNQKNQSNKVSKAYYRRQISNYMKENDLLNPLYPPLSIKFIHKSIPNFKGTDQAARRLSKLEQFKKAKVIMINLDGAQEPVRLLALEAEKKILVRLGNNYFKDFRVVSSEIQKENLNFVVRPSGLREHGDPLDIDAQIKVDLIVCGAMCVSRNGYRIGKGDGLADLEFAFLMRMGAVSNETTVVTTVHDSHVLDDMESILSQKHDMPVDIIVTPTQTIYVSDRMRKPVGIFWNIVTPKL